MAERHNSARRQQSLHVWNSKSTPLSLVLEPWGEQFTVAPESGVDVVGEGPADGRFEVSVQDDGIAVYGWTGSTVEIFRDGEILEPFSDQAPVTGSKPRRSLP
jgi:hypothetical protein